MKMRHIITAQLPESMTRSKQIMSYLYKTTNAGFSLIEILVGMVMGLISMLIVMQVFGSFEGQKRTTTSGSDAQTNGGVALYTLERDIRMAGYGFADAVGCRVYTPQVTPFNISGSAPPSFLLAPVTITQGAGSDLQGNGGQFDTISVMASAKQNWGVPIRNVSLHSTTATSFDVSSTIGIASNDLLIAYETNDLSAQINPGALNKDCALMQVSNPDPVATPVTHTTGGWNGNSAIFPASGYTANAMLINMGSLMAHYYLLDANSNLITREYDSIASPTSLNPDQILFPDIVNLQAQYGFDTRSNAAIQFACPSNTASGQCSIVDTWSGTMINADGLGATGDAGDIARIYAIRFAVVARSGLKEKPDPATGICNATTSANPDNRPRWAGGIVIDVSKTPNGQYPFKDDGITPDPNAWQCYRYKTFETVVPVRNAIWKLR